MKVSRLARWRRFAAAGGALLCAWTALAAEPAEPQMRFQTRSARSPAVAAPDDLAWLQSADAGTPQPLPGDDRGSPDAIALEELIELATLHSPNLREAAAQVRAARGRAWQAGAYPNPTFSGGSPQLAGEFSQYIAFVGQDIVTHGKLALDEAAAMRQADQAQFRYRRVRFELLTAIRRGFYSAAVAQRRQAVLEELAGIAQDNFDTAERRLAAGEGTETDSLLLQIEREQSVAAAEGASSASQAAWRQLAAAAGARELAPVRLDADLSAPLPEFDQDVVRETVLAENALVGASRAEIGEARLRLARAAVQPYPDINLQAGYQYDEGVPSHDQGFLQATITVPLWDKNQGNIRASRAEVGAASARLSRVQNELASEAAAAVGRYVAAQQLVNRYEENILRQAADALRITQRGFSAGEFDLLRLLQAQEVVGEARLGYVNAQESRWLAAADLAGMLQIEQFP